LEPDLVGEGLGVDDSRDLASREQSDRTRERKERTIEGESEARERKTGWQTS
jgi:hypothetical protein